jgi:hypothetical protein
MRLHILTPGFKTPNGRAFLFPLIVHRRALVDAGIEVRLFGDESPELTDCDRLLVDRKFHEPLWPTAESEILDGFARWGDKTPTIFVDTSDSAGWLHVKLLPIVHAYAKGQLLHDRTAYLAPHYGYRAFADYYHRSLGVTDTVPAWSDPVPAPALLEKLRVSWNTGLADYSEFGPHRMALYGRLPWSALLRFPNSRSAPDAGRPTTVSCRFGANYARASVATQRLLIREHMAARMSVDKVSRRRYFAELRQSQVVVSPFGWGEITLKDFEVFLTGGLLFKPDMAGIDTWPKLFVDNQTYIAHRWDLDDFGERLDTILGDASSRMEIAAVGQKTYMKHLNGPDAARLFIERLRHVVA